MIRIIGLRTKAKTQDPLSKQIQRLALAIGTASLFAGAAHAQDDWSGFYAGGHVGTAQASADWSLLAEDGAFTDRGISPTATCGLDPSEVPECNPEFDLSGAVGGLHVGWQQQFGAYVLGAEATYTSTGLEETVVSVIGAEDDEFTTELNDYRTIVARAGWIPPTSEPILLFATAGLAAGDVKTRIEDNDGTITSGEVTELHSGWTVGAGVEYLIQPNIMLGAEYKYADLGSVEHEIDWDLGDFTNDDVDVNLHSLALRVSYKF